jgi:hypothetical protein
MIRQQVGDLLEIEQDGGYFYVVVLSGIVMFGGNILFAFHTSAEKRAADSFRADDSGFNVCCDLLLPKREGRVARLRRFDDVSPFWRTHLAKRTVEYRRGVKAKEWFICRLEDPSHRVARVSRLTPAYQSAMDQICYSFEMVAEKILARYTPDQNEHI